MNKKLIVNQSRVGQWLTLLLALLLLPVGVQAEDYGITIAGVAVTDANAEGVTGGGITGTITYTASTNTLTLNGATVTGVTSTNGCIVTSRSELKIAIIGENTLNCSADSCTTIRSTLQGGGALTFVKGGDHCSLTLKGGHAIRDFASVTVSSGLYWGDDYTYEMGTTNFGSGMSLRNPVGQETYSTEATNAFLNDAQPLGLTVGGVEVTSWNASNVMNDDLSEEGSYATVVFDATTNTLTLHYASLDMSNNPAMCPIESSIQDLKVKLKGYNQTTIADGSDQPHAFRYTGEEQTASLTLLQEADEWGSFGSLYANIEALGNLCRGYALTNQLHPAENETTGWEYGTDNDSGRFFVRYLEYYDIWIGSSRLTSSNRNGGHSGDINYTDEDHTLYLGGISYSFVVKSHLSNLTISLASNNDITNVIFEATTAVPTGTLTFKAKNNYAALNLYTEGDDPLTGFSTVNYEDRLFLTHNTGSQVDYYTVGSVDMPSMYTEEPEVGEGVIVGFEYDNDTYNVYYSIDYVDATMEDVTNALYDDDERILVAASPCTLTAYNQEKTGEQKKSPNVVGKYFGYLPNTQKVITDGTVQEMDIPAVAPAVEESDGITITYTSSNQDVATITEEDKLRLTGATGTTTITATIANYSPYYGTKALNVENEDRELDQLTLTVAVRQEPNYCFTDDATGQSSYPSGSTVSNLTFGLENTLPWLMGAPDGLAITYSTSNEDVATIDEEGHITLTGAGYVWIYASNEETDDYVAHTESIKLEIRPIDPQSLTQGAYYTGQKVTMTSTVPNGEMYYRYGTEDEKVKYTEPLTLAKGKWEIYFYTKCSSEDGEMWSNGNNHPTYYVYDELTFTPESGASSNDDIKVEIGNLPSSTPNATHVYYFFGDDDEDYTNDLLYDTTDKVNVAESTKVNAYIVVDGDSMQTYKTEPVEATYTVIPKTQLNISYAQNSRQWASYYADEKSLETPEGLQANIVTAVSETGVSVSPIDYIPQNVPILLKRTAQAVTEPIMAKAYQDEETADVSSNKLAGTAENKAVKTIEGNVYVLYNDGFTRATSGSIPAHRAYLVISDLDAGARLWIWDDEDATAIGSVRDNSVVTKGALYNLNGQRVSKPTKGLYISDGKKFVVK